jgi:hypothetical protein
LSLFRLVPLLLSLLLSLSFSEARAHSASLHFFLNNALRGSPALPRAHRARNPRCHSLFTHNCPPCVLPRVEEARSPHLKRILHLTPPRCHLCRP